jgi:DNA-binding response OmpR family regulator
MDVRQPWFIAGFCTGCAAAGAAVLLLTPLSGRELKAALQDHVRRAKEDARLAGREAEADVLTRYRQIRGASVDERLGTPPPAASRPAGAS